MERYGITVNIKNKPVLDDSFMPIAIFNKEFLKTATEPITICVEGLNGTVARIDTFVHLTDNMAEADKYYINRLTKALLWMKGGYRILVSGDKALYEYLKDAFAPGGVQEFDYYHNTQLFGRKVEVIYTDNPPEEKYYPKEMGGHLNGCRIGFDAGGSDRKVCAVKDGVTVFEEEVVWLPKINPDSQYHYDGIVSAFKSAAEHLPTVDAVGISAAGTYIDNKTMAASLFLAVPEDEFDSRVRNIFIDSITKTFGDIPFEVINDGDVSAIAGMMSIGETNVLGISMGTSEAGGFVDDKGRVTGWFNELAFMPVDCQENACRDEWSGDIGCGVKYFSQDAVIKLAPKVGITLDSNLSPAEKLKTVQKLMENDDERAKKIYLTIGTYLGHTLNYYYQLYHMKHVLLLGRVMSGKGGDIILEEAKRVLVDEYPDVAAKIIPSLPDEKFRRLGQSNAAASLPMI